MVVDEIAKAGGSAVANYDSVATMAGALEADPDMIAPVVVYRATDAVKDITG